MMRYCDLHAHSTASDGTIPPELMAAAARDARLSAFALTDHDTTTGLPAAAAAAERLGIAFVPGIEISADRSTLKPQTSVPIDPDARLARIGELHMLGLFIRLDDPDLLEVQKEVQHARAQRNPQMVAMLNELGAKIDHEEVVALAAKDGGRIVGRPHIAQVLVAHGYAKSIQDAFSKYIGEGKPAYVRKDHLHPRRGIEAIHAAGGLAILAHPVRMRFADADEMEHAVALLVGWGLDGLETRHSEHSPADVERYEKLAARFNLLSSGGSDFHGLRKTVAFGGQNVPMEIYDRLRIAWENRLSKSIDPAALRRHGAVS